MYKLLLSWRYLRTRFLALASIVSVMLGVTTLIVVNSVMEGFATKLKDRIRGVEADVLIESHSMDGFRDCQGKMEMVRKLLGNKIAAMSPVIEGFAMLQFHMNRYGHLITTNVKVIGVDPATKSQVGEFAQYLANASNKSNPAQSFMVQGAVSEAHEENYPRPRSSMPPPPQRVGDFRDPPAPEPPDVTPEDTRLPGAIVGYGMANYRSQESKPGEPAKDIPIIEPGDEISLVMPSCSDAEGYDGRTGLLRPVLSRFVVTDIWKSGMSEFDSQIVYLDIKDMQRLRTMNGRATAILIKLKDYEHDADQVLKMLEGPFHPSLYSVHTWEQKKASILSAIAIERGILNVLLFLIIAVAGFGILAIFFMIVVEKTRDIGILKALGASNGGVMGVFLGYGLALGIVGAGLGTILGIAITTYINEIEHWLSKLTGHEVFDRHVYYFDKIPTDMQPVMVVLVVLGAVAIAVGASVLPSLRAAMLRPVQALRFE